MANNLIPFKKAWNTKEDRKYGEKEHWFNPTTPIAGIEGCKLDKHGTEIECTKVMYENGTFITLVGTTKEFFEKCREANTAICLWHELDRNGITLKEFLQQTERINGTTLT